jgi:hypothetical protein
LKFKIQIVQKFEHDEYDQSQHHKLIEHDFRNIYKKIIKFGDGMREKNKLQVLIRD